MEKSLIDVKSWSLSQKAIDRKAEELVTSNIDPLNIAIALSAMAKFVESAKKLITEAIKTKIKEAGLNTVHIGNFTITLASRSKKDYSTCSYWRELTGKRDKIVKQYTDDLAMKNANINTEITRIEALMGAINKIIKDPQTGKMIPPVNTTIGAEYYSVKFPKE